MEWFLLVLYVVVSNVKMMHMGFIGGSPIGLASYNTVKSCQASPLDVEDFFAEFWSIFLFTMLATR